MKQWYEKLWENFGKGYDQEPFTQGTIGECDFLEKELNYDRSLEIIDVGCGTGRHTIELTKRGYSVTGIDLSEAQLRRAKEKAKEQNLQIEFFRHDARDLPFDHQFDVAIMLCEGAFPLMETDEMNFQILRSVTKALKRWQVHIHHTQRLISVGAVQSSLWQTRCPRRGRGSCRRQFRSTHHAGTLHLGLHR